MQTIVSEKGKDNGHENYVSFDEVFLTILSTQYTLKPEEIIPE
jgi:hypothetical protein